MAIKILDSEIAAELSLVKNNTKEATLVVIWSLKEQQRFSFLYSKYGDDLSKIASILTTKTLSQIIDYHFRYICLIFLNKILKL